MDTAVLGFVIVISVSCYFLPTIVARFCAVKQAGLIFAVNLFFGWTVVAWIAALIWAMAERARQAPEVTGSLPLDGDNWFFDPPKLSDPSQQVDRWVLGGEHFFTSPRTR